MQRSHSYACEYPTTCKYSTVYGISQGEKFVNDTEVKPVTAPSMGRASHQFTGGYDYNNYENIVKIT